jgi:hypothetical protein
LAAWRIEFFTCVREQFGRVEHANNNKIGLRANSPPFPWPIRSVPGTLKNIDDEENCEWKAFPSIAWRSCAGKHTLAVCTMIIVRTHDRRV